MCYATSVKVQHCDAGLLTDAQRYEQKHIPLCANMLTRRLTAGVSRLVTVISFLLFNVLLVSCERSQFDPQTNGAAPVLALRY